MSEERKESHLSGLEILDCYVPLLLLLVPFRTFEQVFEAHVPLHVVLPGYVLEILLYFTTTGIESRPKRVVREGELVDLGWYICRR